MTGFPHFLEAIRIRPSNEKAYLNLGVILAMHGNLGGAVTYFHKALQINPDYAEADKNPGIGFAQKENLNEAVFHLCETFVDKAGL